MPKYTVTYCVTIWDDDIIEAKDFDEARSKWEAKSIDAELFQIEDEDGNRIEF